MGIIIKKRFGPRNFVQYLHLKDVYSVGPKHRKKQQVYIKSFLRVLRTVCCMICSRVKLKTKEPVNTLQNTVGVREITDRLFGQPNPDNP